MYNYYRQRYKGGKKKPSGRASERNRKKILEVLQHENLCRLCGRPIFFDEKSPGLMNPVIENDEEGNPHPVHYICQKERKKGRPPQNIQRAHTPPKRPPMELPQTINWMEYRSEQ